VFPAPFGFAGEACPERGEGWTDALIGLQYLRARWYDPATGRFTQVDPFPGLLSLPGTQHPYAYALNNPLRYTDPSGEVVIETVVGAAVAGAAIGAAAGGVSYALRHPGKSLGEYFRDAEFRKAVGTGAASGAMAGAVAAAVPLGFAALGLKAATAGGAAFIGGVGGSLAGAAGQITANLLTPCTKWHQGVQRAMFWGGLGGAAFGWAGWHVRQWWTSRVVKATNVYQDNNGYWRTADGRFARNPNLSANDATTRSSAMKETVPAGVC
jgi:RHS repeat-associated protein